LRLFQERTKRSGERVGEVKRKMSGGKGERKAGEKTENCALWRQDKKEAITDMS